MWMSIFTHRRAAITLVLAGLRSAMVAVYAWGFAGLCVGISPDTVHG
jgi:hypothetical protein